jgi:putative NADH-flavin reductase
MRLLILGATGGIGRHLLRIGLAHGHQLTAFVRSPEKVSERSSSLKLIKGDVFNVSQLSESLPGHDCVLSAFGPSTFRSTTLRRDFGHSLALSLQNSNVPRLQVVSSALLFPDIGLVGNVLKSTLFRNLIPDMTDMESEIKQSGVDWTIVRPPRLTNGRATNAYRVADEALPKGGAIVSREDVAEFMIAEAESPTHKRHIVGIAR